MLRSLATEAMSSTKSKGAKSEGTIASVFASLSGDGELGFSLPQRFADMKSSWISGPEHAEKRECGGGLS